MSGRIFVSSSVAAVCKHVAKAQRLHVGNCRALPSQSAAPNAAHSIVPAAREQHEDASVDVEALLREVEEEDDDEAEHSTTEYDVELSGAVEPEPKSESETKSINAGASATAQGQSLPTWFDASLGYQTTDSLKEPLLIPSSDLVETFIRGSGPGGQAINKLSTNVSLLHKPSGVRITCQESRSRDLNRLLARRKMSRMLDEMIRGAQSVTGLKREKQRKKVANKKKKSRRKYRDLQLAKEQQ